MNDKVMRGVFVAIGLAVWMAACGGEDQQVPKAVDAGDAMEVDVIEDASSPDGGDPPGPLEYHSRVSTSYYHTCAVASDGAASCYGLGMHRDEDEGVHDFGQAVAPSGSFVQVSAGSYHSCGLRGDGRLECWGIGTDRGGTDPDLDYDQAHPPEGEFVAVDVNVAYSCGLGEDRTITCWGRIGQRPMGDEKFRQVSVGWGHICGLTEDRSVECFGSGEEPDVDEGDFDFDQSAPPDGEFLQVSAGYLHTCGLRADKSIECWGLGSDPGRNEADDDFNQAVAPAGEFRWVAAGYYHSCGVRADGDLQCWGLGAGDFTGSEYRQFDYGQARERQGPFAEVSTSAFHTCAVRENGEVACWGWSVLGQTDPDHEFGVGDCRRTDHSEYAFYGCSPLCQRGCEDGEMCIRGFRSGVGQTTFCVPEGDRRVGESCGGASGRCEPGLACVYRPDEENICRQLCRRDGDEEPQCPTEATCVGEMPAGYCEPN
jgi:hypothetical protein